MKTLTVSFLLLLFSAINLNAQDNTIVIQAGTEDQKPPLQIGVIAGIVGAYNTTDYNISGVKRALGWGPHLGARVFIPIGTKTQIIAGISYHVLAFKDENERVSFDQELLVNHSSGLDQVLVTEGEFSYTCLVGMFKISSFFIGMQIGFPMKGTITNTMVNNQGESQLPYTQDNWGGRSIEEDISPATEDISTLIELRAGAEFPLVESAMGDLNLGFSLAYTFNNIITDSHDNLPNFDDQFHLPSVMVHISYMFSLTN